MKNLDKAIKMLDDSNEFQKMIHAVEKAYKTPSHYRAGAKKDIVTMIKYNSKLTNGEKGELLEFVERIGRW